MKEVQELTLDAERHRLEADLGARLAMLFHGCPALCGFSVGERAIPAADGEEGVRHLELFVADIDVYPSLGHVQSEKLVDQIASALADLLDESPQAADLIAGRTFARILH